MAGRTRIADEPVDASGFRFAVAVSQFNEDITLRLLDGARDCLSACKVRDEDIEVLSVPGAFELPLACKTLAEAGRFDAVVALGCVIRGETPHFQYISTETSRGLMDAMLATGVPIAFGVLTTDNVEQAEARAGGGRNKGYEAARTAVDMAALIRAVRGPRG